MQFFIDCKADKTVEIYAECQKWNWHLKNIFLKIFKLKFGTRNLFTGHFLTPTMLWRKNRIYSVSPPPPLQEFLCPSITIYALLYSTLLCKNSTCTWRGRKIDRKSHHLGKEKRTCWRSVGIHHIFKIISAHSAHFVRNNGLKRRWHLDPGSYFRKQSKNHAKVFDRFPSKNTGQKVIFCFVFWNFG